MKSVLESCILCGNPDAPVSCVEPNGTKSKCCYICFHAPPPQIICLCGSTKFYEEFAKANLEETLKGNIVLSIGCDTHHVDSQYTIEQKRALDRLHKAKIRLANKVIVLNVDDYIGESTASEIYYAKVCNVDIEYRYPHEEK